VAALFPRWANSAYWIAIAMLAFVIASAIAAPMILIRTPYASGKGAPIVQPVEFDHRHHARDDGIDCLYCHPAAETTSNAGLPPTEVCMGCHGQIWQSSPMLAPVRKSWDEDKAIGWRRVNAVPDFVYFHHGVHVQAGVPCARCHGEVDRMARVERFASLTMGWCLDCHRNPPGATEQHGRRITPLTTCSACHR
jgi:predicted CXXCH cytochrome family protein